MRKLSVHEARQNFSKVIAEAERGESIIVTKNGKPVAKITAQGSDREADPEWQSAYRALVKRLKSKRATGFRLGKLSDDDKRG